MACEQSFVIISRFFSKKEAELWSTVTAGVIRNKIAVPVDVMLRVQGFPFVRVDVVKVLAVEDDAAQPSARRQRHPRSRNVANAALIVAEFLQNFTREFIGKSLCFILSAMVSVIARRTTSTEFSKDIDSTKRPFAMQMRENSSSRKFRSERRGRKRSRKVNEKFTLGCYILRRK